MPRNAEQQFEIPSELRAFTEKSVEQAKQAFDGFISAAHRTVSTFEGQAASAQQDAKKLGEKAVTFAERNIASSFEFAQDVVRAKNVEDMLKLQADYIRAQIKTLTEQAKELGQQTGMTAQSATKSSKSVAQSATKSAKFSGRSTRKAAAQSKG
jgi:phasin